MTTATQVNNQVGNRNPHYDVMLAAWELIDDLMGALVP